MKKLDIDIAATHYADAEIKRKFNHFCGVIVQTYNDFHNIHIEGLKKVFINLHNRQEAANEVYDYEQFFDVCHIDMLFDFNTHFAKPEHARQREILDTLHDSMLLMCEKYNFDRVPFDEAYRKVMEANFEHRTLHNKPTLSKNRKTKAAIEINIREDGAHINVLFMSSNGEEQSRCEVVRLKPNYYFISQLVHKGKWIDNSRYAVSDRREVVRFIASTQSPTVELAINARDDEHRARIVAKLNQLKAE